jgi:hypothetical protein
MKKAGAEEEAPMPESEFVPAATGQKIPGQEGVTGAVFQINRNPNSDEMRKSAPVGRIQTPDYSVEKTSEGTFRNFNMTEAGKRKLEEGKAKMVQKMGKFPGHDDPSSPQPPVDPGEPFFNPFSGQWTEPETDYESLLDKYGS